MNDDMVTLTIKVPKAREDSYRTILRMLQPPSEDCTVLVVGVTWTGEMPTTAVFYCPIGASRKEQVPDMFHGMGMLAASAQCRAASSIKEQPEEKQPIAAAIVFDGMKTVFDHAKLAGEGKNWDEGMENAWKKYRANQ